MKETPRRREYILLEGDGLAQVLKYARENQVAYLFHYGCVVFVNCSTDEMRSMLHFVVSGFCSGSAASYYHESFFLEADDENHYCLFEGALEHLPMDCFVIPTIANALAKLTALAVMEEEIGKTYDEAETFIVHMGRGRINLKAKRYAAEVAKIVRFQYNSAYSVRIFERYDIADAHIGARTLYDAFMAHFEYGERIDALRQKIAALEDIFRIFLSLSQSWQENRELYIEIALLILFPLFYLF
jgi:required for meiotic nuclear division protein 1